MSVHALGCGFAARCPERRSRATGAKINRTPHSCMNEIPNSVNWKKPAQPLNIFVAWGYILVQWELVDTQWTHPRSSRPEIETSSHTRVTNKGSTV